MAQPESEEMRDVVSRIPLALVWCLVVSLVACRQSQADTLLAGWEDAVADFDAQPIDTTPGATGQWHFDASTVTGNLTQGTIGVTEGNSSLKLEMVGAGNGGGTGLQDTHFDRPAVVTYSMFQSDPRFTAIQDAVNGNQDLFTIELDVTYDITMLRSLDWLGPPVDFPAKPEQFIGIGVYGNANQADGNGFQDAVFEDRGGSIIDPFDAQFDGMATFTDHISVPFTNFTFEPDDDTVTFYEIGFSYNGNWGTLALDTVAPVYIDNLVLAEFNPTEPIDFDNDGDADLDDFGIFMANHLTANPAFGDLDDDQDSDFRDFVEFERLFDLVNGVGSLARLTAPVPEPTSWGLCAISMVVGLLVRRRVFH